jgi:Caspase domain
MVSKTMTHSRLERSMRVLPFFVMLFAPFSVHAEAPVRILLSIGQNVGAVDDEPLRYAERDAQHVADLFTSIGDVADGRAYVVTDATAERVRQALAEIRGRSIELRDVVLIVYVSSHAGQDGLHLGASVLQFAELRSLIASVPARLRLLITDACTSGALIRSKGGRPIKPFAIDLEGGRAIEGQVVIASTGSNEPAQEWEALGGALFTYHLLSGLRGAADRNADGRVTLFEAYSYSYDHTLAASTDARAGTQHPSHEIELRGEGDIVLTRPGGRTSGLGLGASLSGRYVVTSSETGELIAEVVKTSGGVVRLALDPGRYLVRKPEGAFVRVGDVWVTPYKLVMLDEADMDQLPYAEVARRGTSPRRTWAVELGFALRSGVVDGQGATPALGAALLRERGPLLFAVGVEAGLTEFEGRQLFATQRELWARADMRWRWPVGWLLPYVGLSLGVGWIHQTFARPDERTIREVFGSHVPSRDGIAARLQPTSGLELPLSARTVLRVEVGAGMNLARTASGWSPSIAALGGVSAGLRF